MIYPILSIDIQILYPYPSISVFIHSQPVIDPAGKSIWVSALPACSGIQLDQELLLHVLHNLHINWVSHCVLSLTPRCSHRRSPGQQRQRLRTQARRRSGTGSRRLRSRHRVLAALAGHYTSSYWRGRPPPPYACQGTGIGRDEGDFHGTAYLAVRPAARAQQRR